MGALEVRWTCAVHRPHVELDYAARVVRRTPVLAYHPSFGMADELDALRRITQRRTRAEREWRDEIRRLFTAGHSIDQIAAAAGVRYEVVVEIVRPT